MLLTSRAYRDDHQVIDLYQKNKDQFSVGACSRRQFFPSEWSRGGWLN